MKKIIIILILLAIAGAGGYWLMNNNDNKTEVKTPNNIMPIKNLAHRITFQTNKGEIQFETYDADAPKTVENFLKLAQQGFYDGLTFHRVIDGFMIQGGDPNCSSVSSPQASAGPCGTGGPGYKFEDELNPETESYKTGYRKGMVAMANAGPNTNGSQFFIMLKDNPLLRHDYTIFGKVVTGQDVVDAIGIVKTGAGDRPIAPVIIEKAIVTSTQ